MFLYSNKLESIDVSTNTSLEYFSVNRNQLSGIDISKNVNLTYLYISSNEIKNIEIKVKDKEEKYKVVGELAYLANGKRSPYITFERFVLASYFQEIIDSANLRLSRMTGERFVLKRKEDTDKLSRIILKYLLAEKDLENVNKWDDLFKNK